MEKNCCNERLRHRTEEELKPLVNRLNRIKGQINGIEKMLLSDAYCPDIIIQASAAKSALDAFSKELLSSHIKTCVIKDIESGNKEKVDELLELIKKIGG